MSVSKMIDDRIKRLKPQYIHAKKNNNIQQEYELNTSISELECLLPDVQKLEAERDELIDILIKYTKTCCPAINCGGCNNNPCFHSELREKIEKLKDTDYKSLLEGGNNE